MEAEVIQVVALFVVVPPVIQVTHLIGGVWNWLRGASWIKRIAGSRRMEVKNPPAGTPPDLMPQEQRQQMEDPHSDN